MKPIQTVVHVLICLTGATVLPAAVAQQAPSQSGAAVAPRTMTSGEVRKVDKDAQKITIKHGPIANLGMPAMTMVFRVKDPAFLDQVKAGGKIRFVAEDIGGQLTVTHLEAAK